MTEATTAHYLAYYELHEIPWRVPKPIILTEERRGFQFQLGSGPYWIPKAASPSTMTRAGGAAVEVVNEPFKLEGGTYLGIAVPAAESGPHGVSPDSIWSWDRASAFADDCAAAVGLCLNQRFALKKVAEYLKETRPNRPRRAEQFRWQMYSGARAAVSARSRSSMIRALERVSGEEVPPPTMTALRWYEQSKQVTVGADRLVALWIALEALMSPGSAPKPVASSAADYLSKPVFKLSDNPVMISKALGLDTIRGLRNDVVHRGLREVPWPVAEDPRKRDWPQILNDIVAEILRHRLRATLTREVNTHFKKGVELVRADP